jgi:hypothetical protein
MIRRDYILRLVAEMVQILLRVVSLKHRREYDQALREVDAALRKVGGGQADAAPTQTVEDWIALCRKHELAASGLMVPVADLLREQGEIHALLGRPAESGRARRLALGLLLEAILGGETFITADLLDKVEELIEATRDLSPSAEISRRLAQYFESRGHHAKAEDAVFAWLETGDPKARSEGRAFYERILKLDDAALERGGLPRAEAEQGMKDFVAASGS